MDNKETHDDIVKAAVDAVSNLVYTVVFDVSNEIISAGAEQDAVLQCANRVVNKYVEGGIKVRKKPAPKAKVSKAPAKDKPVDALTAASRKLNNLGENLVWMYHPQSNEYSYTTSMKLATGYPVRNNMTHKVVMVIGDESTGPLTVKDAKVATAMGLEVDYDAIEK